MFLFPLVEYAQNFADPDYYLVDSLDLTKLTRSDVELIESTLKEYHKMEHDTSKIKALGPICEGMADLGWFKFQQYQFELVIKALTNKPNKVEKEFLLKAKSGALNNYGIYYEIIGESQKALDAYSNSMSIDLKLKHKRGVAYTLNNIGFVYDKQGKIEEALTHYHKSLKLLESLGDKFGIAHTCNNIGLVYYNQGESQKAKENHLRALKLRKEIDDKSGIANSYNNLGLIYGNSSEGYRYHLNSLKIRNEIGDDYGAGFSLINLGKNKLIHNEIDSAIVHFQKSLEIRETIGDKNGETVSLKYLGECYLKKGELSKAKEFLHKSLKIAQEIGYPQEIQIAAQELSNYYEQVKNYKEAFSLYKLHIQMRDSLHNDQTQKAAAKQQAQYEYEKQKAVDDAEHEKQLAIEHEAKQKQQILTYATGGGLGLVGIFLLFVFNRLKVTRKQKGVIEEAHTELEEKNKEITDSIQYAKRIQGAILPQNKVVKEYLQESFILYKPKDIVAGDFYWLEQKDNKVIFAAADCTGHGVPGAMVSVVCNNGLNRSVREYGLTDPGEILNKTREIVVQEFEKSEEEVKDGMDIALCCLEGNTLHYAGAHNPLWIIRKGANEIEEIKADKQPIGQTDNPLPYTTHKVELNKGDSIYIFSDGYADQFGGEKGKKMKTANFKKLLLSIKDEEMTKQKELIDEAFESWKGELEQLDDVCVIGVSL